MSAPRLFCLAVAFCLRFETEPRVSPRLAPLQTTVSPLGLAPPGCRIVVRPVRRQRRCPRRRLRCGDRRVGSQCRRRARRRKEWPIRYQIHSNTVTSPATWPPIGFFAATVDHEPLSPEVEAGPVYFEGWRIAIAGRGRPAPHRGHDLVLPPGCVPRPRAGVGHLRALEGLGSSGSRAAGAPDGRLKVGPR